MQAPEGHTCEEGVAFGQSFLPCGRDIWEARSTSRWITNFDRYLARKHMDEDLRGIHLLESKLSSSGGGSSSACMGPADNKSPNADVVHWCEGLDMLGTLVWMVVPLHRYRTEQLRERMAR
jgi:hypothetical protein